MSVIPQSDAKRKLLAAARQAQLILPAQCPPVFWMTDPDRTPAIENTIHKMPSNWAVIYRHFGQSNRVEEAKQLSSLCKRRKILFLVANDPRLAKQCRADGVHWPHVNLQQARYWRDAFEIMTVSAHSGRELRQLPPNIFSAVLLSCVFPSNSPTAGTPVGAHRFRAMAKASPLPCYGLGGIDENNAQRITSAGGLAMVSTIENVFGS